MRVGLGGEPSCAAPAAAAAVLRQKFAATLAAVVLATSSPAALPAAQAPPPTTLELQRLSFGLARIDYLLENWDTITTVCSGVSQGGDLEDMQVVGTLNKNKCFKTPLKVQKYIGAASTLDPLFKVDKLMIRAQPIVPEANQDAYGDAVDSWITKQQMSSTMAYTSSWSGYENPNGNTGAIDETLLEAKNEVVETRQTLAAVVKLLGDQVPSSPKFNPNDSSTFPLFK